MNMSINLFFHTLSDDRCAPRQRSIVCICPSPIKLHLPPVHDIFPPFFDRLVMDFGMANVFHIKKSNHTITSQSSGLMIDNSLNEVANTGDVAEGLMIALNLQNFWLMT
jgi:hypothetical protein